MKAIAYATVQPMHEYFLALGNEWSEKAQMDAEFTGHDVQSKLGRDSVNLTTLKEMATVAMSEAQPLAKDNLLRLVGASVGGVVTTAEWSRWTSSAASVLHNTPSDEVMGWLPAALRDSILSTFKK